MARFNPPQRVPKLLDLFAKAIPTVALLAGIINVNKQAWSVAAFLNLVGVVLISTFVCVLLLMEIRRQLRCEVSEAGFFTTEWALKVSYPFIAMKQGSYPWEDVEDIGRSGYTLFLKTQDGKKKMNLFVFQDPEVVADFAVKQWQLKRRAQ